MGVFDYFFKVRKGGEDFVLKKRKISQVQI